MSPRGVRVPHPVCSLSANSAEHMRCFSVAAAPMFHLLLRSAPQSCQAEFENAED